MSTVTLLSLWLVIQKGSDLVIGNILLDEFLFWVIIAFIASIIGLNIVKKFYIRRYIVNKLKKELEVYNAEGKYIGLLSEISKKNGVITVKTEKHKKIRISFGRIALVQDEFIVARV